MVCYICAYLHEHLWGLRISSRCLPHFPTLFFETRLSLNPEFPVICRLAGLSPGVYPSLNPQYYDYRVTDTTTTPGFYVNECWGSQELMLTTEPSPHSCIALATMKSDKWQVWAPTVDNGHVISLLNSFCSFLCERETDVALLRANCDDCWTDQCENRLHTVQNPGNRCQLPFWVKIPPRRKCLRRLFRSQSF